MNLPKIGPSSILNHYNSQDSESIRGIHCFLNWIVFDMIPMNFSWFQYLISHSLSHILFLIWELDLEFKLYQSITRTVWTIKLFEWLWTRPKCNSASPAFPLIVCSDPNPFPEPQWKCNWTSSYGFSKLAPDIVEPFYGSNIESIQ